MENNLRFDINRKASISGLSTHWMDFSELASII